MRIWIFTLLLVSTLFYSHFAFAETGFANRVEVKIFINQMVKKYHFKRTELVKLFSAVKPRPTVIRSIKAPLEQRPWYTYQMVFITESRIRQGVEFWNKYQDVLARAEKMYGVPASIIVATIGVETKYGKNTGEFRVIDALVNIAFSDSPRAPYFLNELKEFLLLTREQHLDPLKVMGSYAGAIGQPQFMPSSYRYYAVNFSGDRKIDLSKSEADVIGSIANYYKKHGWKTNEPIAIPAALVGKKYQFFLNKNNDVKMISRSMLAEYGIVPKGAVTTDQKFKLIELRGYWGNEYWLGFHNFDVIKQYNPSDLYAMAVFQLSYYIETLREKLNHA